MRKDGGQIVRESSSLGVMLYIGKRKFEKSIHVESQKSAFVVVTESEKISLEGVLSLLCPSCCHNILIKCYQVVAYTFVILEKPPSPVVQGWVFQLSTDILIQSFS